MVFAKPEFYFQRNMAHYEFELRLLDRREDGLYVAQPAILKQTDRNSAVYPEPMLTMDEEASTLLMNELWRAGIRPSKAIVEPTHTSHLDGEINWLRDVADHLMKRTKT